MGELETDQFGSHAGVAGDADGEEREVGNLREERMVILMFEFCFATYTSRA